MSDNQESERGIIPAGTVVNIGARTMTLLNDVSVNVDQVCVNAALDNAKSILNGDVMGAAIKECLQQNPGAPTGKSGGVIGGVKNNEWML